MATKEPPPKLKTLSKADLEEIRTKLLALRSSNSKSLGGRTLISPNPPPRYDDVFREGQRWLDSLE
ncbi:MAG TPA: hypothetical protein VLX28_23095 [Thermoanaerobaculia bacterium]|nr:hypothetical protein [Thermoanaerobaculia bacterium]